MNGRLRSSARTLVRWCVAMLPAERACWGDAMRAEIEAIGDDRAALEFAVGCLWTSTKERVRAPGFKTVAIRNGMLVVMLALALVAGVLAIKNASASSSVAAVFVLCSAIFAGAAILFRAKGAAFLIRLAITNIPLYVISLCFVQLFDPGTKNAGLSKLYSALAIEGIFVWTVFFVAAMFLRRSDPASITQES